MSAVTADIRRRVDALDWDALHTQLNEQGHAITSPLLRSEECGDHADHLDRGHFR